MEYLGTHLDRGIHLRPPRQRVSSNALPVDVAYGSCPGVAFWEIGPLRIQNSQTVSWVCIYRCLRHSELLPLSRRRKWNVD